jgi:hypothetical protein
VKIVAFLALLAVPALAEDCRVLVGGTGCRTRQLAIERIFETIPGVRDVLILPREEAPEDNQRIFVIHSDGQTPDLEQLIEILGRRAKYYHVISVKPASTDEP